MGVVWVDAACWMVEACVGSSPVFASADRIMIDSTYGRAVRAQRKAAGDFRFGVRGVVELDWLQHNPVQPAQTASGASKLVRFQNDNAGQD